MHRLEYRKSAHRSLPAVILWLSLAQLASHKIRRVPRNRRHPDALDIRQIRGSQFESAAKLRSTKLI
jgi:hypothetical protein